MRKRDLGILLVSVFSIFVSLQHEGSFSFKESWYYGIDETTNPTSHETIRLPPPVVIDLNGDGRPEVIVATHDAKLQVLETGLEHAGEGSREARLLTEISMTKMRVSTGRQPVSLAAGFLDPPVLDNGQRAIRKAVIVVVTAGWSILCYDHNLKLLWENNVQESFPHGARHKEVAILISNQTMQHGDKGVVIVGGSMEIHPQAFMDPFEEEELAEKEEERHRLRAGKKEAQEDVSGGAAGLKERHFSYYAYNGQDGDMRWHHNSKDFHRDASALSERLLPQHNYKLDAGALSSRHFGEVECRDYRESVLAAMPHRWERREDTYFELAHFKKHRRRPTKKQPGGLHEQHGTPSKLTAGRDSRNLVANAVNKMVKVAASAKILKPEEAAHGNLTGYWWAPNAIVAHLKEGIEAIHLYSGRTICKLLLADGGLHADLNGDGVLDHVQVSGAHGGERLVAAGMHEPMHACWAVATSGIPVKEQLFNGSICRHSGSHLLQQTDFASRSFGRNADGEGPQPIEVATPVFLPRKDGHHHRRGSRGDAIFLNSQGDVSSYEAEGLKSHHGRLRWQVSTEASWEPNYAPEGVVAEPVVSTLEAMPLRTGGQPEVILASGEHTAVVLSRNGHFLTTFMLPTLLTTPLIIVDFNNDGLNDLIALTSLGLYGFVQVRQPGAVLVSALLGFLIVGMSVVFLTQTINASKGKRDRRSTD